MKRILLTTILSLFCLIGYGQNINIECKESKSYYGIIRKTKFEALIREKSIMYFVNREPFASYARSIDSISGVETVWYCPSNEVIKVVYKPLTIEINDVLFYNCLIQK
jgi:hypothetical protein